MNLDLVRDKFEERTGEKLNVKDFGDRLGISHTMLYKWKQGKGTTKLDTIFRIMEITGLKFNQIFTKDELQSD